MKLAGLLVIFSLTSLTGVARADNGPPPPRPRAQLRQLLLHHFDRNHDGRLEPRERKQAARALRRLAMRIEHGAPRAQRQRRFIQRFDRNHDGNVGPGEMPPHLADELRPLDRDGDGWLRGDELPWRSRALRPELRHHGP